MKLFLCDAWRLNGLKVEIYSLSCSTVNIWSTENVGKLDVNLEVELWVRAGQIKIKLGSPVDVLKVDRLISACVLMSR